MLSRLTLLLNKPKENDVSSQEKRELISSCSNIALQLICKKFHNDFLKFSHQGLTFHDVAVDSITPLFIRDKSGEFPIRKALLS